MQYEHRERVFSVKKTIDTESPPQFMHLEQNLKRVQQEEGRF